MIALCSIVWSNFTMKTDLIMRVNENSPLMTLNELVLEALNIYQLYRRLPISSIKFYVGFRIINFTSLAMVLIPTKLVIINNQDHIFCADHQSLFQ